MVNQSQSSVCGLVLQVVCCNLKIAYEAFFAKRYFSGNRWHTKTATPEPLSVIV